jgi:hypothetical protein
MGVNLVKGARYVAQTFTRGKGFIKRKNMPVSGIKSGGIPCRNAVASCNAFNALQHRRHSNVFKMKPRDLD